MVVPDRWVRIRTLLEELSSLPAGERRAALAIVRTDDGDIAREVESLLRASEEADADFLEPFSTGSGDIEPQEADPHLARGTRLGNFEVQTLIGAGGMGQVYRARDVRLDRAVAIKILPPRLARNRANREWFEREARTISRLAHPHVCVLHDVGVAADAGDERVFLVMELIEGTTLADRLSHGPLAIDEAVTCAIQIAEALAAAHAQGIVHFDLKPSNIMVTKAGVKLLDFGLARFREPWGRPDAAGPLKDDETRRVVIGGTLPYVSPEQLRGEAGDWRTDLFAFGAVLYEMLSGARPFVADTPAGVIAAILEDDPPPILRTDGSVPAALEALARTCLAKAPDDRWQSAHDVVLQLKTLAPRTADAPPGQSWRTRGLPRAGWIAAILAIAVIPIAMKPAARGSERQPAPSRLMFEAPSVLAGQLVSPIISRDRRSVGFIGHSPTQRYQFFLRSLQTGDTRQAGVAGAWAGDWTVDGRQLVTMSMGQLQALDVDSGRVTVLTELPPELSTAYGGVSQSPDGTLLVGGPVLYRLIRGQSALTAAYRPDPEVSLQIWPSFLPNGRDFLFAQMARDPARRGLFLGSLGSDRVERLLPDVTNAVFAAGMVLFGRDGSLMAQRFDEARRSLQGEPVVIAEHVAREASTTSYTQFAVGGDVLVYVPDEPHTGSEIVSFDRGGHQTGTVGEPAMYRQLTMSPDGDRLAVEKADTIWLVDLARGNAQRANAGMRKDAAFGGELDAAWSPDGDHLVFTAWIDGEADLFSVGVNPPRAPARVAKLPRMQWAEQWSPDGRSILFSQSDSADKVSLWALPLAGGEPRALVDTPYWNDEAQLSPDQRWLAYVSDESGRFDVYVQPHGRPGARLMISPRGGGQPKWRGDGRELFYLAPDGTMMSVAVDARGGPREARPLFRTPLHPTPFLDEYAVTPDGQKFLVLSPARTGPLARVMVVSNWRGLIAH